MSATAEPRLLQELFAYVGFGARDRELLVRLRAVLRPAFPAIVDAFYHAVEENPRARAVFTGGRPQIERQKHRLADWLEGVFSGVYDDAYFERRARIGRVHVQIDLDQRYMFGGMNIVRSGLHRALDAAPDIAREDRADGHLAIDRICDIELAIMLETYRERFVQRQRAQERLATIGQLAASIGHELRNPLAVMETSIHLLRRRVEDEGARRHFDRIAQQIGVSSAIIDDLLALARDRPPQRDLVDLAELAREAASVVPVPPAVEIRIDIPADLPPVWIDRTQFRQVLVNLVANAVEAITGSGEGSRVDIGARVDGTELVLAASDDGPGLPGEVRSDLFEPLVTTRPAGVGLGLALCKRIVEKHGGRIEAETPAAGARIVIRVPDAVGAAA